MKLSASIKFPPAPPLLAVVRDGGWAFWLSALLLLVFSLPHTIALRNVLIVLLLLLVGRRLGELRALAHLSPVRLAFGALAALLLWMLCVTFFLAPDPGSSLDAFFGEWVRAALVFLAGCGAVLVIKQKSLDGLSAKVALLIFLSTAAHMIGHDIAALLEGIDKEGLPARFSGITDHRANVTYVFALMLSVIGADVCSRHVLGRRLIPVSLGVVCVLLVLGCLALLTSSTTNGWIVAILVTILIVLVALFWRGPGPGSSKNLRMLVFAIGIVVVGVAVTAVVNDKRYDGFLETVAIGWDTKGNRAWLDAHHTDRWPLRSNGEEVDPSTYSRVAWGKEGILLLIENPLGTEISKHTFERLIREKYGVAYMSHSHLGFVDFGLNVGLPGMALWLGFLGALIFAGTGAVRKSRDPIGLVMVFMVAGFGLRMLIDSTLRDHILEQFMFCAGMLLVACALAIGGTRDAAVESR